MQFDTLQTNNKAENKNDGLEQGDCVHKNIEEKCSGNDLIYLRKSRNAITNRGEDVISEVKRIYNSFL